jgi:hypothetical protein
MTDPIFDPSRSHNADERVFCRRPQDAPNTRWRPTMSFSPATTGDHEVLTDVAEALHYAPF